MADENKEKAKGAKPELTPEQEAEAAAKKAARAEAKAKGVKVAKGKKDAAAAKEVAMERVKRDQPARLRKLYDTEVKQRLARRSRTPSCWTRRSRSWGPSPASARSSPAPRSRSPSSSCAPARRSA
jgi:hypothetical protein